MVLARSLTPVPLETEEECELLRQNSKLKCKLNISQKHERVASVGRLFCSFISYRLLTDCYFCWKALEGHSDILLFGACRWRGMIMEMKMPIGRNERPWSFRLGPIYTHTHIYPSLFKPFHMKPASCANTICLSFRFIPHHSLHQTFS